VYALGGTLFAAVTGARPYTAGTRASTIQAHRVQPVPSITARTSQSLPKEAEGIIQRMMAKDPAQRFGSMDEVIAALRPFAVRKPIRYDAAKLARLRAKLAERKLRGLSTRASNLRSSSVPRLNSSIITPTQTTDKAETDVARPGSRPAPHDPQGVPATAAASRAAGQLVSPAAASHGDRLKVTGTLEFEDGRRVPLIQSGYSMGRGPANDLRFDGGDLSTRHAQLSYDGTDWWLSDLDSKNGVRINGQPVRDQKLKHGDRAQLAQSVTFRFEDARAVASRRNLRLLVAAVAAAIAAATWWLLMH
ncbi:MAG: FHA domain-containing protein, partial [Planctomycetaceae bacterium]|nr:FHA domain-containing protein [Planctomycetaceae bacterium]